MTDKTTRSSILKASKNPDWQQVVLNQGPPCFHVEDDKRFCFRAYRWPGHNEVHKFISFNDLLVALAEKPND